MEGVLAINRKGGCRAWAIPEDGHGYEKVLHRQLSRGGCLDANSKKRSHQKARRRGVAERGVMTRSHTPMAWVLNLDAAEEAST